MSMPTIDILLATFNGAAFISEQMESLLRQTYPSFRILISDDGSTDQTPCIIHSYVSQYPDRVIYIPNPQPGQGAMRNFEHLMNTSLTQGQAQWFAFADQDDIWRPDKLAQCAEAMQRIEPSDHNSIPCLVHTDLYVMDAAATPLHSSFVQYEGLNPQSATPESLLSVNVVTGCTTLVNRPLLILALPIPSEAIVHDWWCAIISGAGRRVFIPLATVGYRQHQTNHIGARNRSLPSRLKRLATSLPAVLGRIHMLSELTWNQAQALNIRLNERGVFAPFVSNYLSWRQHSKWVRFANYRRYYFGPELDRFSRWWFWRGAPAANPPQNTKACTEH